MLVFQFPPLHIERVRNQLLPLRELGILLSLDSLLTICWSLQICNQFLLSCVVYPLLLHTVTDRFQRVDRSPMLVDLHLLLYILVVIVFLRTWDHMQRSHLGILVYALLYLVSSLDGCVEDRDVYGFQLVIDLLDWLFGEYILDDTLLLGDLGESILVRDLLFLDLGNVLEVRVCNLVDDFIFLDQYLLLRYNFVPLCNLSFQGSDDLLFLLCFVDELLLIVDKLLLLQDDLLLLDHVQEI